MFLADMGSATKRRLSGRSCPGSPADIISDSEMADSNLDCKLFVKYLPYQARNGREMRTGRIAELIMAGSTPCDRGIGMSKCS